MCVYAREFLQSAILTAMWHVWRGASADSVGACSRIGVSVQKKCSHVCYRLAKTHSMLYLYRAFSAEEPCDWWLFCGKKFATGRAVILASSPPCTPYARALNESKLVLPICKSQRCDAYPHSHDAVSPRGVGQRDEGQAVGRRGAV